MDFGAALLGLLTAGVVKVLVMLLGGHLLLAHTGGHALPTARRYLRQLPLPEGTEFRLLWWSLVLFCVSEVVCGVELYILAQAHVALTTTHAVTSSLGMGLFALAMLLYFDRRIFRFQRDRCIGRRVCGGCTLRAAAEGCKAHQLLLLGAVFMILAGAFPFFVSTASIPALPERYALPIPALNQWYDHTVVPWLTANFDSYRRTGVAFVLPEWVWLLEFRALPALALCLSAGAAVLVVRRRDELAVQLMVFGTGVLAYVYLEILIYRGTGEALLGSLMHEVAELWFLLALGELLQRIVAQAPASARVEAGAR
ncbi:MAG: hypothetical protein HYV63_22265 [Candidatus Schekmanbacteria bacterium]|nr:hypothetical protein [Candidatus Schekmanbacteria bacterium]